MFSIHEILGMAIRIEQNGERFYREARANITDESLAPMLQCLAEEEQRHQAFFKKLQEDSKQGGEHWAEEIGGSMLQNVVGNQTFSLKEWDASRFTSEQKILEAAIEFESDTILFMEMLRDFVQDEDTLKELDDLIAEEQRHKDTLHRCLTCRRPLCKELNSVIQ